MNKTIRAYINLSLAMIIVGTSVVAGKMISSSLPIFLSSFLSLFIASLLFLPSIIPILKSKVLTKSDYLYLSIQALLGTVLYRIFFFFGLKYVDASFAGILTALQPAMITVLAIAFLKEKISKKEALGVVLAVAGLTTAFLANKINVTFDQNLLIGTALVILAVFGEACFSVFAKKLNKEVSPMAIAGMVTLISTFLTLPTALYDLQRYNLFSLSTQGILLILYYGVFLTYISFILWFEGLKHARASIAGVFTALVPVSGVLFSILFLNEQPSLFEILGGVLILLSIILVVYKNGK